MENWIYVIRGVMAILVITSIIGVIAMSQKSRLETSGKKLKAGWKKVWGSTSGDVVLTIAGVVAINGVLWIVFPEWFKTIWSEYYGRLTGLLVFLIFGAMFLLPKPTIPVRYRVGKLLVWGSALAIIFFLTKTGKEMWEMRDIGERTTVDAIHLPQSGFPLPGENQAGRRIVTQFFEENLDEGFQADLMIEIARLESGWNQFEADGTTPLRGRVNPRDICIMQINEDYWGEDAKELGHDLTTVNGCLEMALWIYQNHGADEWNTYQTALVRVGDTGIPVTAPTDEWSEIIPTPGPFNWSSTGPVLIQKSDGTEIADHPTEPVRIGNTRSLRFRSRAEEAVQVTVYLR